VRTTLDLPEDLFRALKARAALEGTTLKALVTQLVRAGLAASDAAHVRRTPSRLPAPVRGARTMRVYSNAELAALADSLTDERPPKR
jgi:plasmid stability protein